MRLIGKAFAGLAPILGQKNLPVGWPFFPISRAHGGALVFDGFQPIWQHRPDDLEGVPWSRLRQERRSATMGLVKPSAVLVVLFLTGLANGPSPAAADNKIQLKPGATRPGGTISVKPTDLLDGQSAEM